MKISVTRSGGVAGIRRQGEVDTSERPDAEIWHQLLRSADLSSVPPHRPAPDRFVYTIRVNGRETTIGEADLVGSRRELVDRVLFDA